MAFIPADWQTSVQLDIEDVWNGFFLHALLQEHFEQETILELVHHAPSQTSHLQPALQAQNLCMAGPGQEAWAHACNRCCYIFEKEGQLCMYLYIRLENQPAMNFSIRPNPFYCN